MPIKIPDALPAVKVLNNENIFVMTEKRAITQDIRPLKLLLLNLMPLKIDTETQLSRLLGNTPLQIEMEFLCTKTHNSKNTPQSHLQTFYKHFDDVKDRKYDGMIITGAPVEKLEFEDVDHWKELCEIMEWSKTNVHSTFHICWGAQAGLYYHFGIKKYPLKEKLSGVYRHRIVRKTSMLFRGADDEFFVPHSRYTEVRYEDCAAVDELRIISLSDKAGVYALATDNGRQVFITGHPEYDADTLNKEYVRDVNAGIGPNVPENYFPNDDPTQKPLCRWRSHANLLYSNWLNYYVYQTTPYDLNEL